MSTTEVNQQPAADAGDGELPETATAQQESLLPGVRTSAWRRWLPRLAPALVYLAIREIGLLMLAWMAARGGGTVTSALTAWDGHWFLAIARDGYDGVPGDLVDNFGRHTSATPLAFFPGYPYVVRWVAGLPGVGLDPAHVETNIVIFDVAATGVAATAIAERTLAEHGVRLCPLSATVIRAVTHLDVDRAGVGAAVEALASVLSASATISA